ncbi:MAG: Cobyric acid synthase [Thermodesulfobacteria bacterium]|nr:cobyric acid synthase [Thermodesulfobacteriota bacterium]MCU4138373.1 Cobyric acid synthase [Thermodesulfobacteriota bacterium]
MAKTLMIVGTSSGAGKSLLVSALGRLALKRGFKVAPFKAQNMSLQSYITLDGGEIGLAQALQAKACGVEPEVHFNPILLKAEGKQGSQVILHGKVYKTLKPEKYYQEKDKLWDYVKASLKYLSKKYELLIIEGAGSPAEINLLDVDIVNMRVAEYLNSPVFLVGDIDKGGVFASLYGTMELLKFYKARWFSLIKGFIINKFRGDARILLPGIKKLEKLSNKNCYGIIPYFENLAISEEDGFNLPTRKEFLAREKDFIKITVLRLKYISNFYDFDPFRWEPDVELVYSLRTEDIVNADIIIIPGSKKTIEDLKTLKKLGIKEVLKKALRRGAELIGICGGFQMLGEVIKDPFQVESMKKEIKTLGFLEVETEFYPEKITTQVEASSLIEKDFHKLWGYEIHMGRTFGNLNLFKIKRLATGEETLDGFIKGRVWGTYLHGIFHNDSFRRALINRHRIKKGWKPIEFTYSYNKFLERNFNFLADLIEKHLEIEKIFELIKK